MKTRYFAYSDGRYAGAVCAPDSEIVAPAGAREVPVAPYDSRQKWLGDHWGDILITLDERRAALLAALASIDAGSARPLRAILVGSATDSDRARLAELDEQAAALRAELATLEPPPAA